VVGWGALMVARFQLYLFLAAAFVLGALGIYATGVQRGADRAQRKVDGRRLGNMQAAKEVEDEIEILDDVDLARRAAEWVRNDKE
jgi:hypothetical protein